MATHKITPYGKLTNRQKQSFPNLRIEAWDKDLLIDDFLAETVTDAKGQFTLTIDPGKFEELFLDESPNVYFKIYHGDRLIESTYESARYNLKGDLTGIELVVEYRAIPDNPGTDIKPDAKTLMPKTTPEW